MKEVKKKLAALKAKAEKIIEDINPFFFLAFEEAFFAVASEAKSRMLEDCSIKPSTG